MDEIFEKFEDWYLSKKEEWKQAGVLVEEAGLGFYGHQYWIKLHAANGLGQIVLYESNGYYWVDFEGANYYSDDMFLKAGIEFDGMSDLDALEGKLIKFIAQHEMSN